MLYAPIAERLSSIPRIASGSAWSPAARRMRRLPAIDAARGSAMVLVCMSHFAAKYIAPAGGDAPGGWLSFVSHVASPMFFVISGAMVGYLYSARPDAFDRIRATLARRALFFLTVGHLLILGVHARSMADLTGSARMLFVTDTIAIALLVSPRLLGIRPRYRLIGAALTYVASTALVFLWDPHGLVLRIVKDTLIGAEGPGFWQYNVPVLPWLAVHAAGTVLGARLAGTLIGKTRMRFESQLAAVGCAIATAGVATRFSCQVLLDHVLSGSGRPAAVVRALSSPWQRVPPSPVHMLLFGGMALIAIATVFTVERLGLFAKLLGWLSVLGKTSAFVFILQFYVFYVIIPALVPISLLLAPLVFVAAMLAIGESARLWLHARERFTRPWWLLGTATVVTSQRR
jgi:uncharacterized membrane protein